MNINQFIKEHWPEMDDHEIGKKFGVSSESIRKRRQRLKLTSIHSNGIGLKLSEAEQIERDLTLKGLRDRHSQTDKKYKILLDRVEAVEKEKVAILQMKDSVEVHTIEPHKGGDNSEAVAVMVASDWHVEESVLAEQVNGLNHYDLSESRLRADKFFRNGHRLLKIFQKDVEIKKVVVPLLGDFISNSIHDELMESNLLQPIDAIMYAQNLIASGIEFLLKDKSIEKIILPCHSGNHGRTTKERRISTENGNSLEFFMYHVLQNHFRNEPRVEFLISKSYHSYLDIFGYTLRFHHGHNISYGGGVGGITISVNKAIAQWDKVKKADLDVFGHFHQFMDGGKFISNGSMIGYNAYALSIKASYEPPKQAMFLIDRKRAKTIVAPILFT